MKDYCTKCRKAVPTISVGGKEECMICGTEITETKKSFINKMTEKTVKEITESDSDTGAYKNAQRIGRGVLIGGILMILGILYIFGGAAAILEFVFFIALVIIFGMVAIYLYRKSKGL